MASSTFFASSLVDSRAFRVDAMHGVSTGTQVDTFSTAQTGTSS